MKVTLESKTLVAIGPNCQELGISLDDLMTFALSEIDWRFANGVACTLDAGWDQAVALTAVDIGLPVHVVIPSRAFVERLRGSVKRFAEKIMDRADTVTYIDHRSNSLDYAAVNHWLLSECADEVIGLIAPGWSSSRLSVATLRKMPLRNLWPAFVEVNQ